MVEELAVDVLAYALETDADAQEAGRHDLIGDCTTTCWAWCPVLGLACKRPVDGFHFWDCWVDARSHDWQYYPDTHEGCPPPR